MLIFGNTKLVINMRCKIMKKKNNIRKKLEAYMKYLMGECGQGKAVPGYQK